MSVRTTYWTRKLKVQTVYSSYDWTF